jgi:GNAT superfamily N-acetyltransferase
VTVTVCVAEAGHAAAAAEVLRRSIRELCGPDYGHDLALLDAWCANKTPAQVTAWAADPALYTVVAERAGVVVGVAQVAPTPGEVTLCYVRPEATGAGSALLVALEAEAVRRGLRRLTLTSTATARSFYERRGYTAAGPPAAFGPGEVWPLAKALGA